MMMMMMMMMILRIDVSFNSFKSRGPFSLAQCIFIRQTKDLDL